MSFESDCVCCLKCKERIVYQDTCIIVSSVLCGILDYAIRYEGQLCVGYPNSVLAFHVSCFADMATTEYQNLERNRGLC